MVKLSYSEKSLIIIFMIIVILTSMIYFVSAEDVLSSGITPKIKIGSSNTTNISSKTNTTNTTNTNPINNSSNPNSNNSSTNPIINNTNLNTDTIQNNTNNQITEQPSAQTTSNTNSNANNPSNNVIKVNPQKASSSNPTEKKPSAPENKPGITGAVVSTEKSFDWKIILIFFSFILASFIVLLLVYSYRKNKSDNVKEFSVKK